MKALICFTLLIFNLIVYAQDTIYKRTGEIITAKISEINIKDISYKRADLIDGPLFVSNKNDILKIKYANGVTDTFEIVKDSEKQVSAYQYPVFLVPASNNEITNSVRRGVYLYQSQTISERNVMYLVANKNQVWQNKTIDYHISEYKKNKTLQYSIGFGGAAFCGATLMGCLFSTEVNTTASDNVINASIAFADVSLFIASQVISASFKFKAIKHSDKLVQLHNQYSKN